MSEKIWHIKRCGLFEKLTQEELSRLESRSRAKKFPRKTPIYLPAEEANSVLLLASGRAKICSITPDGKQAILAFIEQGELFGELALLNPAEREEYAEAVEPSLVILIPGDEVQRLMEDHPNVSLGVTKLIGLRRRRVERRLKSLLYRSNRDRLVHLLLELAEDYGKASPEGVQINIRLSHQELASVIGSTRETVTVLLGELQLEGYIRVARRRITIRKLEALAASIEARVPRLPAVPRPEPARTGM